MATSTSSSCSTRTRRPGADIHDQGDTVADRVNDDVESDRDDELAHDTEDFARTAAVPRIVGYTGGHVETDTNRFFISKIYLLAEERGKHYASQIIGFYTDLCRSRDLHSMYLTVNKQNDLGIRAYYGKGFVTIESVKNDIGNGFAMDDYVMEKEA